MTFTATYIAEENCLQELPQWEAPRPSVDDIFGPYAEIDRSRMIAYKKHLATLRKIPCDPSCKGLWADQQKVVEGKDYQIKEEVCGIHGVLARHDEPCNNCKLVAFPLVPVKSDIQDRTFTFHETLDLIADFGRHVLSAKNDKWDMANDAAEWLNDQLKNQSLTKR